MGMIKDKNKKDLKVAEGDDRMRWLDGRESQ